jgi:hypothetical protein
VHHRAKPILAPQQNKWGAVAARRFQKRNGRCEAVSESKRFVEVGGIYEKMAKLGLRYFLKVITVLETL